MRQFHLVRNEDPSGVSGTGLVAEGVVFHDGQTIVSWFGKYHSVEVWPDVDSMIAVHGHSGKTVLEYV